MVMASIPKVVLGSIAFAIFWVVTVFPTVPILPIGRAAGSLLGAMLMVLFKVITPDQAYAAINLPILGLLFGTMVVSVFLERANMFKYLGKLLSWKSRGAKDLLFRICLISALSSAFFTNNISCVVLTEFVLQIARQHNLPPHPFLLALTSSANIGSMVAPIGNPHNLLIVIQSKISFGEFFIRILPSLLVGVVVNALILVLMYWKLLSIHKDEEDASVEVVAEEDLSSHQFSPINMSHITSPNSHHRNSYLESSNIQNSSLVRASSVQSIRNQEILSEIEIQMSPSVTLSSTRNSDVLEWVMNELPSQTRVETRPLRDENMHSLEEQEEKIAKWKRILMKSSIYTITLGMSVALLLGLNMSWTVITAALALVVLDFKDAWLSLEKVSYSLLIFLCGMSIAIDGFNKTGIPSALWDLMKPYSQPNHASGIAILTIVILALSNMALDIPTVLLLGGKLGVSIATSSEAEEKKAWLIVAWVSTVAGNLSLLGSIANLIVCEQACRVPNQACTLTFLSHLKFGLPSTLIVIAIGLTLIR